VSLVEPGTAVAELREQVRAARAEGRRLAPAGGGTQRGWCRVDLDPEAPLLDLAGLSGIVEYEPGEGTLTALAGTTWEELERAVAEGGHRLPADLCVRPGGTLGGVVAVGRSGPDRFHAQALRHHLLGMQVLLGDGTVARSGGRLVKNVTGFDLHRLHCGARGTLGAILEVSLRLRPEPEAEAVVSLACDAASPRTASAVAELVRSGARLRWGVLRASDAEARLDLGLDGRRAQILRDAESVAAALGADATISLDAEARALRLAARDAGCEDLFTHELQGTRAAILRGVADGRWPEAWCDLLAPRVLLAGAPAEEVPGDLHLRPLAAFGAARHPRARAWEARVRQQLDPDGVFAAASSAGGAS
jgi:FAD/FMN-containing dehydrogenase